MKPFKLILGSHALYIFITAIWPLIDINSFMALTGVKIDIWLVKTVSALLIAVSLTMLSHLTTYQVTTPAIVLSVGTAIALLSVDVYYSFTNVISDVYLVDAAIEVVFVAGWISIGLKKKNV